MRHVVLVTLASLWLSVAAGAQGGAPFQPVATMSELMVAMVYPAANDILLSVNRGAPTADKGWVALQHSALVLAESGNVLMMPGHARDQGEWMTHAKAMVDAGSSAYKAARAKDAKALAGAAESLDRSCTECHRAYRPEVHPKS